MIFLKRIPNSPIGLATTLLLLSIPNAQGAIIATFAEVPGSLTTSVNNAFVTSFDALPTGINTNVPFMEGTTQVGTYDQLRVVPGDQYGGAGGSAYVIPSGNGNVTTLTLTTPSAYFGLWWSAGDASNELDFYSGITLLAKFTTNNLLKALPSSYKGNPSGPFAGQNAGEAYAYLNFFGDAGVAWDRIVFHSAQFESDNHALRTASWDPGVEGPYPGVPFESINGTSEQVITPEPAAGLLSVVGGALILLSRWKRSSDSAVWG